MEEFTNFRFDTHYTNVCVKFDDFFKQQEKEKANPKPVVKKIHRLKAPNVRF